KYCSVLIIALHHTYFSSCHRPYKIIEIGVYDCVIFLSYFYVYFVSLSSSSQFFKISKQLKPLHTFQSMNNYHLQKLKLLLILALIKLMKFVGKYNLTLIIHFIYVKILAFSLQTEKSKLF